MFSFLRTHQGAVGTYCGGYGPTSYCLPGNACVPLNETHFHCVPEARNAVPVTQSTHPTKKVGKLPALGWNTWNAYRCDINEEKILDAANLIVSLGLKGAGYEYVNIDDCWSQHNRTEKQELQPDYKLFPNGIKGVADAVHRLGLKIGIYSDAGSLTCAGYPGSLGYEDIDAETWAKWDIDYLKYDNCNVPGGWADPKWPKADYDWYDSPSAHRYRRMTDALGKVSRPMEFGLCNWGEANVWTWGARVGHSWRIRLDSSPEWSYIVDAIGVGAKYADYTDFWGHNDLDMMEVGNGNLTIEEQRTHFAAWAFLKSPILIGTDLSKLSAGELKIIKNKQLLAFHQDATVGASAKPYKDSKRSSTPEYYAGASSNGHGVFVINLKNKAALKTITFSEIPGLVSAPAYNLLDMWTGERVAIVIGSYSFDLAAHDTAAFLVTPITAWQRMWDDVPQQLQVWWTLVQQVLGMA